jgi:hypothetical protein
MLEMEISPEGIDTHSDRCSVKTATWALYPAPLGPLPSARSHTLAITCAPNREMARAYQKIGREMARIEIVKALKPTFAMIWVRTSSTSECGWIALHGIGLGCGEVFGCGYDALIKATSRHQPTTEEFVVSVEAHAARYRAIIEKNAAEFAGRRMPVITVVYSDDLPPDGLGAAPG